jgi:ribonuclease VapC
MVIDSSALVAVILKEPGHHAIVEKMVDSPGNLVSAVSYMETSMVLLTRRGEIAVQELSQLMLELDCTLVPVSVEQARLAIDAFRQCGKVRHPAGLNFGDCFNYALAKSSGEPLLFKGLGSGKTDIASA